MRARPAVTVVCLALGLGGCTRHDGPQRTTEAAADTTASAPAPAAASDSTPVLRPATLTRVAGPSWFPHEPHVRANVACRACHPSVPGHGTHSAVACRTCHRPAAEGAGRMLTRTECLACHHGEKQRVACTTCHDPLPGPLTVQRRIELSVWPEARRRSLTFPHARHSGLECRTCHQDPPLLTRTRTCGSCHDRHHRPDADCSTCHEEPSPTAHDLRVHLGCSGTGCHAEEKVAFIRPTRAACLVCHRDRVDHEPGRECATCHHVELRS